MSKAYNFNKILITILNEIQRGILKGYDESALHIDLLPLGKLDQKKSSIKDLCKRARARIQIEFLLTYNY